MNRCLIILFFVTIPTLHCNEFSQKILNAHIRANQWKILENEIERNYLDIFSLRPTEGEYSDVIFLAWKATMDALKTANITFEVLAHNVNATLSQIRINASKRSNIGAGGIIVPPYPTYDQIAEVLHATSKLSSPAKNISITSIGKSMENRDIVMIKIEHSSHNKIAIIDAGMHAREWLSITTALYLITKLATDTVDGLTKMNWYIVPCLNPDGYVYSYKKNRLHIKNMNWEKCTETCSRCGVDINRNFGYRYNATHASGHYCSESYSGEGPFSERESRALRSILTEHADHTLLYISLHSFGSMILYPWRYSKQPCEDWNDLVSAGNVAAKAINDYAKSSTPFIVLSAGRDTYISSGSSDDFAKSLNIKYVYAIQLQQAGKTGFDPSADQTQIFTTQFFHGIVALCEFINAGKLRSKAVPSGKQAARHIPVKNCAVTRAQSVLLTIIFCTSLYPFSW